MAEEQPQRAEALPSLSTPFPAPPPFFKHFTKENVAKVRQIQAETGEATKTKTITEDVNHGIDVLSLPPELRYLSPPKPPTDGKFKAFGYDLDLDAPDPTLEDAGIESLIPSQPSVRLNPQAHLIALARSLLTTFLALAGILSENAELFQEKVQDLQTIVYNMHDLINQYRPHQARETLIVMMEDRIEKLKGETKAIWEGREKVAKLLQDVEKASHEKPKNTVEEDTTVEEVPKDDEKAKRVRIESQRAAWAALNDGNSVGE